MLLQFWMIPLANFTSTWLEHVGTCSSLGDTPTCGHQNIWKTFFHKCVKLIMVFSSISSCPTCLKPVPQFGHPDLLFLPSPEPERRGLERFVLPAASPRSSPSSAASASRGSAARVGRTTSLPRCPTKASRCSPATRPGAQGIPSEANYETDKNRNY